MAHTHFTLLLAVAVAGGILVSQANAAVAKVGVGEKVENLTFKDIRYLPRSLDDFKDKKAIVIVAVNTTCPIVKRYVPKLKRLEAEYRDKGVQFVTLNASPDESIREMAAYALEFEIEFPSVKDLDGSCVQALGLTRTPEVVIIDAERKLRYRGRIDDQYRLGGAKPTIGEESLVAALDAILAGTEVAVKETPVDGCAITLPSTPDSTETITYAKHVEPLMAKHCVACHRLGTEAGFPLLTYEDVRAQGETLAEVVSEQRMPPWFATTAHGDFVNKRGLTPREEATIIQWVKTGMQPGDLPQEKVAATDTSVPVNPWLIGEPDLILKADHHKLQAEGYIAYKYSMLPHKFEHDTWVQGIQILPDNNAVVHHCNLLAIPEGGNARNAMFITGKVPGGDPTNLQDGDAIRIPKGTTLVLQIHYTTTGKEEECQISLGLRYPRGTVQKELRLMDVVSHDFAIEPYHPHHKVVATKTLEKDSIGVGLFTHMHVRGKDMTYIAHYPDGKSETLLMIPNYSFDWQMSYRWDQGAKKFPAGTKIEVVAHYDNSTFNPYNPDPSKKVTEGQQTYEEMMYGFVFYHDAAEQLSMQVDPTNGKKIE